MCVDDHRGAQLHVSCHGIWSFSKIYSLRRLQEIASEMEKCYFAPWTPFTDGSSGYKLALVSTVKSSIQTCWKKGVYLYTLTHRFWKLTLQILARLITWLTAIGQGQVGVARQALSELS